MALVSGGLDSAVTLAEARAAGFRCVAVSFEYGQRHIVELEAAGRVAKALGAVEHIVARIDIRAFGGSALTDDIAVPKDRAEEVMAGEIPVTYVPARNLIFLSYAAGVAESRGAGDIFLGVNAVDYSGYPDCRPEFIEAFAQCAGLATKAGAEGGAFRIHTPLIEMTKAEIILRGLELGVDFGLTHSCYDPDESGRACGRCDSCALRRRGFVEAGVVDPTQYSPEFR